MSSPNKALQKQAVPLVRAAQKTLSYRAHLIPQADAEAIAALGTKADAIISGKGEQASPGELAQLDTLLAKHGASYYRHPGWAENVETIIVAIILAIGIRTFFLQPFSIPTNSMYPTYHGMTYELNSLSESRGVAERAGRFLKEIALTSEVIAPAKGRYKIQTNFGVPDGRDYIAFQTIGSGLPINLPMVSPVRREYEFVGPEGQKASLKVPADFSSVGEIIFKTWFPEAAAYVKHGQGEKLGAWYRDMSAKGLIRIEDGRPWLYLDHEFQAGEKIVSFDILTGDKLFVDRFSYHFCPPSAGESFVFRTREVPGIIKSPQNPESYYIKRLAGEPGDTLEIKGKQLFRNGSLATGAIGFDNNNNLVGEYEGYVTDGGAAQQYLTKDSAHKLPPNHFFALGDNSDQSQDSRYFGDVPGEAVVGKALFIHYPFTSRWGRAR